MAVESPPPRSITISPMNDALTTRLEQRARQVDEALRGYLADAGDSPPRLVEAMRYSTEAGGKRLRPALVIECCVLCGAGERFALPAAAAVECVHTFSLIHDDLPAMDNDDLRRGRPTNHKVFGEALAILAGDALLTLAFEIIARHVRVPAKAADMILVLAEATGRAGMIGGQVLDLEAESRRDVAARAGSTSPVDHRAGGDDVLARVNRIHAKKTAALIETACRLGALSASAGDAPLAAVAAYGRALGLAFQAVDDLLDVSGNSATLGKTVGKDSRAGKLTLVSAVGAPEGWRIAESLAAEAAEALRPFGAAAAPLIDLARFVVTRAC